MKFLYPFLISLIAGLSTLIGSLIILLNIKKEKINKFIVFSLAFSLTIMIMISITDLIPSSLFTIINHYKWARGVVYAIIVFVLGVIIINKLDILISKKTINQQNLYKLGILNMIALILHNLPEGVATFAASYQNINLGIKLSLAIMLHNIPEGITIAVPIYYATKNKLLAFKTTLLSGLSEPLGALLSYVFLKNYINNYTLSFILIFVAGIMISLSINKILEEALKYHENKFIYYGIILGIVITTLSLFIL